MKYEKFELSMGKAFAGGSLSVVGYRFGSGGPSTYIQGGTHGGEITYPIFNRIFEHLKNVDGKGTITLLPLANPISWMQRLYFYTAGKFSMYDGKDWNWFFPGKKEGTTAQRFAYMIFEEAKKHEFIIDLHTSRLSKPFLIVTNEKQLSMAKQIGSAFTQIIDLKSVAARQGIVPLSGAAEEAGLDGYSLECGSHDSLDEESITYSTNLVLNTLEFRGHIAEKTAMTPGIYYSKLITYNAPETGFVEYIHPLETKLKKVKPYTRYILPIP
jgi:predicted deacylase